MEIICDLHVHSKYARGCSPRMGIREMAREAKIKGIHLMGTGDFTHPQYLEEIKKECEESDNGLLLCDNTCFVPTVEINNTFEQPAGKKRRIHTLIVMPSLQEAEQFNEFISKKSKLGVDGRPWVRMSLAETAEECYSISKKSLLIPAHAWTPWYGIFGAKGGFDSLADAFEGAEKYVHSIETGLSSDPQMNWRCSWLDKVSLVSFSDAHSPQKLGREATVVEGEEISYNALFDAIAKKGNGNLKKTIEFFPQEGKYYSDGCRNCLLRSTPAQTKKYGGRCPKCNKKITKGVLGRIDELADREEGEKPKGAPAYESIVPLKEIISMAIGKGVATASVEQVYLKLIKEFGNEFFVLLNADIEKIKKIKYEKKDYLEAVANAIFRMRKGELIIEPGYDGKFGVVGL